MTDVVLSGGCLCGAIRYQADAMPFAADYCHCSKCRKHNGSVVVAWMDFKAEQVYWLKDMPVEYVSSETVRRGFCAKCGSTITYGDTRYRQYTTLTISSLDDANLVQPTYHIYLDDKVSWLDINDNCKRYAQGSS